MDGHSSIRQQLTGLYQGLSSSQRLTVLGGAVLAGSGLFWLAGGESREMRPLLDGRSFTAGELRDGKRKLSAAGLEDFEIDGNRILVDAQHAADYETVLQPDEARSPRWVDAWQNANATLGHFSGSREQEEASGIARASLVSRLLAELPDVEHAEIIWDEEPPRGWKQPPKTRATVYLKPRPGRAITLATVRAVRLAVAGSKAHLRSSDVVVMDLERMETYSADAEGLPGAAGSNQAALLRDRIEHALTHIPGAAVSVSCDAPDMTALAAEHDAKVASSVATAAHEWVSGPNLHLEVNPVAHATLRGESRSSTSTTTLRPALARVNVVVRIPAAYTQPRIASAIPSDSLSSSEEIRRIAANVQSREQAALTERILAALPPDLSARATVNIAVEFDPPMLPVATPSALAPAPLWSSVPIAEWSAFARQHRGWVLACGLGLIALIGQWVRRQFADDAEFDEATNAVATPASAALAASSVEGGSSHLANQTSTQRRSSRLSFLADYEPEVWIRQLAGESPGRIAVLLRHLSSDEVSQVLAALPDDVQHDVLERAATLGDSDSPELAAACRELQTSLALQPRPTEVRTLPTSGSTSLPEWTAFDDAQAAPGFRGVNRLHAAFDDEPLDIDHLAACSAESLRAMYGAVPEEVWSMALRGASREVEQRLLQALAPAESASLRRALRSPRPVRLRDLEEAHRRILSSLDGRVPIR